MSKKVRYIACLLLLLATTLTQAQQKQAMLLNIRGTVYENEKLHPMEGAAVKLYNERDSMVTGATTKQNGQFILPGIPAATYTLQVSFMGFKTQKFKLVLPQKSGNYKVADVMMREDATVMAEAVVEGKLPEMTVIDDTVAYNADAFKLPEGSMVEDLIKKLPGIVQDENGNYTFNGKNISQILVDGKEFFGNNRNLVLQNLPAEIVDKVKAYDRKSDMARITGIDDGNERTVLDLAIKKDRKKGLFGRADGTYGTHDRYSGNLNINSFRGDEKYSFVGSANNTQGNGLSDNQRLGTTMNWENKVLELNGSVNGDFSQNSSASESNSQNFELKNSAYSANKNHSSNHNGNFGFQYRMEWKPDSTWNIMFRPEFSFSRSHGEGGNESATWNDDPFQFSPTPLADYAALAKQIGVNHRLGDNWSSSKNINASASLQINKRLKKPGRNITLNLGGGYGDSDNNGNSYSQTDYYLLQALSGEDSVYHKVQYNRGSNYSYNFNARFSYSEPIAYQTFLQLTYNYRYNFRDNDRDVRSIFDPYNDILGVNQYNYDNFFDSEYVVQDKQQCSYTKNIGQNHDLRLQVRINRTKYRLTIGGNVQPQISKVDYHKGRIDTLLRRTVVNASPVVNFQYRFSRQEQLEFRYNADTGWPNITDMIPDTLSDANPLNIRIGNAELKPSFTQNVQFEYRRTVIDYQRTNAINLQFNTTRNSTTNRTEYNEVTGGRVSMPVNVNGNWRASANYNFNTALDSKKHWRFDMNTSLSSSKNIGYLYRSKDKMTVENITRSGNFGQRLRLTFRQDWESGYQVEANANGRFTYNLNRSNNATASNLDHYNFNYGGSFVITFPWGMTISSDIEQQSRRGYSDAVMNTNHLIWNGSISQRFLPYKQLTISLRAVDILDERDDVNRNVSAVSRTDTKNEMVRSYVLLSANWRFGRFGGRGMMGGRGRGEGGQRGGGGGFGGGPRGGGGGGFGGGGGRF
ncbi:MAG: outer membrane beta-barrel protein [Bacteroidaceae bacterium]|nr:outer membrane beta-barrel protein [Bacteroidaceae bacterium]